MDLTTRRNLRGALVPPSSPCAGCMENLSWCIYNCSFDKQFVPANVAANLAAVDGLDQWENQCMELVDAVLKKHPEADILWVEPIEKGELLPGTEWVYHAVPVLDGVVHDAWNADMMLPPAMYVRAVFGDRVAELELNPGQRVERGETTQSEQQG